MQKWGIIVKAKGGTVWFSGLHCAGKTTISNKLVKRLRENGVQVVVLEGDIVRKAISSDLDYTIEDRNKHIKRVADICELISKNGVLNIACVASPSKEIGEYARKNIPEFIEVFVDCPLEVCEKRGVKGHYKKARAGVDGFDKFLGISIPYEIPKNPDLVLKTNNESEEKSVERLFSKLVEEKWLC